MIRFWPRGFLNHRAPPSLGCHFAGDIFGMDSQGEEGRTIGRRSANSKSEGREREIKERERERIHNGCDGQWAREALAAGPLSSRVGFIRAKGPYVGAQCAGDP